MPGLLKPAVSACLQRRLMLLKLLLSGINSVCRWAFSRWWTLNLASLGARGCTPVLEFRVHLPQTDRQGRCKATNPSPLLPSQKLELLRRARQRRTCLF